MENFVCQDEKQKFHKKIAGSDDERGHTSFPIVVTIGDIIPYTGSYFTHLLHTQRKGLQLYRICSPKVVT